MAKKSALEKFAAVYCCNLFFPWTFWCMIAMWNFRWSCTKKSVAVREILIAQCFRKKVCTIALRIAGKSLFRSFFQSVCLMEASKCTTALHWTFAFKLKEEISETDKKVKIQNKTRFHRFIRKEVNKSAFNPPSPVSRAKNSVFEEIESREEKSACREAQKKVLQGSEHKKKKRSLCWCG